MPFRVIPNTDGIVSMRVAITALLVTEMARFQKITKPHLFIADYISNLGAKGLPQHTTMTDVASTRFSYWYLV